MRTVVVVGGGISGLAAAHFLTEAGQDVVVLEASGEVGGKLKTGTIAGIDVDLGAESVLARRPEALGLIGAVGLQDEVIAPSTTAASVRVGGVLRPLPRKTMLGVPADLDAVRESGVLSEGGLALLAAEPSREPLPPITEDVSVGRLVRDRLGDEVADRLVEPLLGGVYAGRADNLSLRATMPALARALTEGGSLVAAAQRVTDVGTHDPGTAGPVFASLRGGIGTLPQALAKTLNVRTNVTVRAIERTARGFRLVCGAVPDTTVIEADAVVLAVPAPKAARLLADLAPAASRELAGVETASMALTTFAFRDVELPVGSGLLVGAREGLAVKAVTVSSHKWPMETSGGTPINKGVADGGDITVLRASVGRAGETESLQREDADLVALVRRDLRALLGLTAEPVDTIVTRWGGGLPQYAVGHPEKVERIRTSVASVPGLAVAGATYDGVGIPACIASARAAADRVLAQLAHPR
ncbi:MAG TPA: protoporphyrinogen oxidase [Jatrophihabitans sp.]